MSDQTRQFVILQALADMLGAENCRLRNYAETELPAINLVPDEDTPEPEDTMDDLNTFRFHARHIVMGVDSANATADALFLASYRAISADRTLGGAVRRIRCIGRKWEMEQQELQQIALVATYECSYTTRQDDPGIAGY